MQMCTAKPQDTWQALPAHQITNPSRAPYHDVLVQFSLDRQDLSGDRPTASLGSSCESSFPEGVAVFSILAVRDYALHIMTL